MVQKIPPHFFFFFFSLPKKKEKKDIIAIKVLPATRDKSKTFSERCDDNDYDFHFFFSLFVATLVMDAAILRQQQQLQQEQLKLQQEQIQQQQNVINQVGGQPLPIPTSSSGAAIGNHTCNMQSNSFETNQC